MFSHLNNYILDESLGTEARTKKKRRELITISVKLKLFFSRVNLILSLVGTLRYTLLPQTYLVCVVLVK